MMINIKKFIILTLIFLSGFYMTGKVDARRPRAAELGIKIGILNPGKLNAITDVAGVKVGHFTLVKSGHIRTGVTAVLAHGDNLFLQKVPAAVYTANGFGKLTGISQIEELGNIETPIILTNTLSVPTAADALIDYILALPGNEDVRSVNPVVGETNDGWLNDIRGRHIKKKHVLKAINSASPGQVEEGCVGAGTGTLCLGFKGGIGTASRILPENLGGYTVGVLVQTNFGGALDITGCPVGRELGRYFLKGRLDGSCMIVVATDAPLCTRNLKRLARRAILGLARTGGICSNGSGDYVIAFSTAKNLRIPFQTEAGLVKSEVLRNERMSPLFLAVIEAGEEAILNSIFKATTTKGREERSIEAISIDKVTEILRKYNRIH
ncbi:MAG: P1 family peptidase [Candidatus Aminicenantes bacterium]|nr:P1 family peptidase [Candidatus Aminicenantes bacterium]